MLKKAFWFSIIYFAVSAIIFVVEKKNNANMTYWLLVLFNFIATAIAFLLFVGADNLKESLIVTKTISQAQEEAQKIIDNAKIKMYEMINKAKQERANVEKEIEQKKNEYYSFKINADETLTEIVNLINDCYIKNQQLLSGTQTLLQRLSNAAQNNNKDREKALKKFEKLKTETIELVRKNAINKTLSDAIIKKLLENTPSNKSNESTFTSATERMDADIRERIKKTLQQDKRKF